MIGCDNLIALLLHILKLLGIILLVILGLIVLIAAIILFVPIRYRIKATKEEELSVIGKISWLGNLLHVRLQYDGEEFTYVVRICGIRFDVEGYLKRRKLKKSRKLQQSHRKKKVNVIKNPVLDKERGVMKEQIVQSSDEQVIHSMTKKLDEEETHEVIPKVTKKTEEEMEDGITDKIIQFFMRVKNWIIKLIQFIISIKKKFRDILNSIKNIRKRISSIKGFLFLEDNREGFRFAFTAIIDLLRYVGPQRLKCTIHFGTGDPCSTGQLLGALSVLHVKYADQIRLIPNFDDKVLEADVYAKGRIRGIRFIRVAVSFYTNKHFKKVLDNFSTLKEEL